MRGIALCALLLVSACADQSALLLEFRSELAVPDEVNQLELQVTGIESGKTLSRRLQFDDAFPQTFSLLPAGDDSESVRITATARLRTDGDELGTFVVRRVVESSFASDEEKRVIIELPRDCVGIECAEGVDCQGGRCSTSSVPDAGVPDASSPECTDHPECDDGDPCNGVERCESGRCISPMTPDCDDGIACTVDTCADRACAHEPDDTLCKPGDTCVVPGGCGGRPCSMDENCNDGRACNGREVCNAGRCTTERPPDCDDDIACTLDSCIDAQGGCVHAPRSAVCSDNTFCNGDEVCDEKDGCVSGTAPSCNDGVACTDDSCGDGAGCSNACCHLTRDVDRDGYGDEACAPAGGRPANDCNDRNALVFPEAPETCDGVDEDCDDMIDEACVGGCGGTCPSSTRITLPGGRFTVPTSGSSYSGTCGGDTGADAVLTFTLTTVSDVFVTTHGSRTDTVLYVRSCSCAGPEVGCNDDADGVTTSALALPSTAPGTYSVFVDTKTAMSVSTQVDLYVTPPGNARGDRCGYPLPLTSALETGTTCGTSSDNNRTCDGSQSARGGDRVYYIVVDEDIPSATIDTCTGCTDFDSILDLRSVCTDAASTVGTACNDDACSAACATGRPMAQSRISTALPQGLFYVLVDGANTECGPYELTTEGLVSPP